MQACGSDLSVDLRVDLSVDLSVALSMDLSVDLSSAAVDDHDRRLKAAGQNRLKAGQ